AEPDAACGSARGRIATAFCAAFSETDANSRDAAPAEYARSCLRSHRNVPAVNAATIASPASIVTGEPTILMMLTSIDWLASLPSRSDPGGVCPTACLSALAPNLAAPSESGSGSLLERPSSFG